MDAARGGGDGAPRAHDEQGRSAARVEDGAHGGVVREDDVAGARHGRWQHVPAVGALRSEDPRDRGHPA